MSTHDFLQIIADVLDDIAIRTHERACTSCKAGVFGFCRNTEACLRTMDDALHLVTAAEYLRLA